MINENTGFDADGNSKVNEDVRSPDPAVRDPAIDRLRQSAANFGPSLLEQRGIIRNIKNSGGGPNNVNRACAV